jgi:lipid-A-disaccharide synthase
MLAAAEKIAEKMPDCQFFLPIASTISREIVHDIINMYTITVNLTTDRTYDLMGLADISIAASGTATLEAALMKLPTVIIYKVAALTYFFGKFLVKIPYISLPNIIAGRCILPELLQSEANADHIANETLAILSDAHLRQRILQDLDDVRNKLGQEGAVQRVAEVILEVAKKNSGGRQ